MLTLSSLTILRELCSHTFRCQRSSTRARGIHLGLILWMSLSGIVRGSVIIAAVKLSFFITCRLILPKASHCQSVSPARAEPHILEESGRGLQFMPAASSQLQLATWHSTYSPKGMKVVLPFTCLEDDMASCAHRLSASSRPVSDTWHESSST